MRFVGLDLHRRTLEVCILDATGKVLARHSVACERNSLEAFARAHLEPADKLAVEATTSTWAVSAIFRPFVAAIVVGNPMQTRAIAQAKVKTDEIDAEVLANLLRCEFLPEVWEPDGVTQRLRHLTGVPSALVGDRTRFKNRIHGVLAGLLVVLPEGGLFTAKGLAWVRALELPEDARGTVDRFLRLYDAVDAELESLDAQLRTLAHHDDRVRLLMTLPGVAHGVALTLVAALGDVARFSDGDHAASYLGLTPIVRQSAGKCYRGPITKAGSSTARAMLTQAAQHAAEHPGPLGAFYRRLKKRKARNVAIVATARKLVTIAFLMLKNNEPYRYARPERVQAKLRHVERAAEEAGKSTKPKTGQPPGSELKDRLNRTYARVGLPEVKGPQIWPPGERRALDAAGAREFAEAVHAPPPRKGPKPKVAELEA
ncbi:IS110 family transposase [Paludisphaera mucosa]|uniref:IS110 family transposase n=1 Tax=Paludisphaera mucosa TaxID=3030827 RepID=A0ABT6FE39_9BACT|nr:IS110 family transposase [Paludisphaera mucosa]MDG3005843.1 IS110 family transposase [Paludisphaera mucosa]